MSDPGARDEEHSRSSTTPASPTSPAAAEEATPLSAPAKRAAAVLQQVVDALPGGGEVRPGQRTMAAAVADAIAGGNHLVVQAGTGTGKSLAYLAPAVAAAQSKQSAHATEDGGGRVVVATATKALQDQLAGKDLPFLATHVDEPPRVALLKGRANYGCRQKAREVLSGAEQLELVVHSTRAEVRELANWVEDAVTGDRADLDAEPSWEAWAAVSVSAQECPGASRCPAGDVCHAEAARRDAAQADVIVVNTHLYGLHLASGGVVLPPHDIVILDEAHQVEDVISATAGAEISTGRFSALTRTVGAIVSDDALGDRLTQAGAIVARTLEANVGRRLFHKARDRTADEEVSRALVVAAEAVANCLAVLAKIPDDDRVGSGGTDDGTSVTNRKRRAVQAATALADDLRSAGDVPKGWVAWVEGPDHNPSLRLAPIDVATVLGPLWEVPTVILTSATIPPGLSERLGVPPSRVTTLDVGSPFDYEANALLYCGLDLPEPRSDQFEPAMHDALVELINAAGGRTLALFTSFRAMRAAAEEVAGRVSYRVMTQEDLPKPKLTREFTTEESSCLFATMSFWQGIDVPGDALRLVTIDKLPFPRPDEPLLQARRDEARGAAFRVVDLPRATTMLAQGVGRLIRTGSDRGVVAVFDRRLGKANYRWDLVGALPPMRRTKERAEAVAYLRSLDSSGDERDVRDRAAAADGHEG